MKKQKNKGISLIVLVITIIVMIILATAVVLTLSNSGIINKANDAVDGTDLANMQDLATMIWSDVYLELRVDGTVDAGELKTKVEERLAQVVPNYDTKYTVDITESGVTVEKLVILTPGERYYGAANVVPTNPEYFEYDYDETTMTATLTGVKSTYAEISYYEWEGNSDPFTSAIIVDGTKITDVVIPYETIGEDEQTYTITAIGERAFGVPHGATTNKTNYTSFILPNTITSIDSYAFVFCSSLTSITIPGSVTSIGSSAFSGCSALEEVYFIGDIEEWLNINFSGLNSNPCFSGANLYFNNVLVQNITIPSSVTSIGSCAFAGCSGLTSITIPSSVTSIGYSAFYDCSGLTSITIPSGVTSIASTVFAGCSGLTSITIPASVTSIRSEAFYGCRSLTSITIPSGVKSIDSSVFTDCSNLTSAIFENTSGWSAGNTSIDVSDAATAATYLKSTYRNANWTRTDAE